MTPSSSSASITTSNSNLAFIEAVIRWLAGFPTSPLTASSSISHLISPYNLYLLFSLLLNKNDFESINDHGETSNYSKYFSREYAIDYRMGSEEEDLVIPQSLITQIQLLSKAVEAHTTALESLSTSSSYRKITEKSIHLNWLKAILLSDIEEISNLCKLMLLIGTTTSKMSTFGLASIRFLNASDQARIDAVLGAKEEEEEEQGPVRYGSFEAKPFHLKGKSDKTNLNFLSEDHINAITWENSVLEEVIYEMVTSSKV